MQKYGVDEPSDDVIIEEDPQQQNDAVRKSTNNDSGKLLRLSIEHKIALENQISDKVQAEHERMANTFRQVEEESQ